MVLQDTWLKTGTIRENITMGNRTRQREEIIEAAKSISHPQLYFQTSKGIRYMDHRRRWWSVTGTEAAFVYCASDAVPSAMLILDEATSSIDTRTELKIQQAFAKLMEGRTRLLLLIVCLRFGRQM